VKPMKWLAFLMFVVVVGTCATYLTDGIYAQEPAPASPAPAPQEQTIALSASLERVVELEKKVQGLERLLSAVNTRTAPTPKEARKQMRANFKAVCTELGLSFDSVEVNAQGQRLVRCK
jgi:hypothetical protein